MKKISVALHPQTKPVEIIFGSEFLFTEKTVNKLKPLASRFALFCDASVAKLYGNKWVSYLKKAGLECEPFIFPPGEQEKSQERKTELENLLFSQKFGRDTCMIALGGGVATDLVGFLASTYCRGVPLIFVPTTLLAMVDAAIGGKTGINTRFGKNLLGTYYPADKILIDLSLLSTLPKSEWTNGLAEVIKYGLIRSKKLFEALKKWDPKNPEKIIQECIQIKTKVVKEDYEEKTGLRRILNFGHTIGHAVELLENYRISHGEAIAIGLLVESYLSMKMGILPKESFHEIDQLIRSFPFKLSCAIRKDAMLAALASDKKAAKGKVRFVLLEKIGICSPFNGEYCTKIPNPILDQGLNWMIKEFGGRK